MKYDDLFSLAPDAVVELNRGGPRGTVARCSMVGAPRVELDWRGRVELVRVRLSSGGEVWHPVSRTHKVTT